MIVGACNMLTALIQVDPHASAMERTGAIMYVIEFRRTKAKSTDEVPHTEPHRRAMQLMLTQLSHYGV